MLVNKVENVLHNWDWSTMFYIIKIDTLRMFVKLKMFDNVENVRLNQDWSTKLRMLSNLRMFKKVENAWKA